MWHCNSKFGNQEKCSTPTLQAETIQQMFVLYNGTEIPVESKAA